jgi:hypothetical protein
MRPSESVPKAGVPFGYQALDFHHWLVRDPQCTPAAFKTALEIEWLSARSILAWRNEEDGQGDKEILSQNILDVVAAAYLRPGFRQCVDQSRNAADTTSSPYTAFQEREIPPEHTLRFVVGDWVGVAYFTSEPGGLRLVATIATVQGTEGAPVRFVTTLALNQRATISVPQKAFYGGANGFSSKAPRTPTTDLRNALHLKWS